VVYVTVTVLLTSTSDIIVTADDNLFQQVLNDSNYVLAPLLPDRLHSQYDIRPRRHDRELCLTFAPKLHLPFDDLHSHLIHPLLDWPRSLPQTASRSN